MRTLLPRLTLPLLLLAPLAGCGGDAPAEFEGTALHAPFTVRSALFREVQLGQNNPPTGAVRLLFSDASDYCDFLRRAREAMARGEPAPAQPEQTASLALLLNGSELPPGAVTAGTYVGLPMTGEAPAAALWATGALGERGTEGGLISSGTVRVDAAALREGSELTGELALEIAGGVQGSLQGAFRATYCGSL